MTGLIIGGLVLLALVAVVVGVVDAAQASAWRRIAADRRERWESRQPELHGRFEPSGGPGSYRGPHPDGGPDPDESPDAWDED